MCTLYVYIQPGIRKFSTHTNTSSFNGLILSIHWLTVKKACLWQMLMYTTWILQQVVLNSYSDQLLVPGSPGFPADSQTHTGSLWQLVWPVLCPQMSWCPSSSQISDLLVSAVSGPDSLLLGSQAFCLASLAWSLPEVTHWYRYPGSVPGLWPLFSGASSTPGPCDLWYNSSCWHPCFRTWSHPMEISPHPGKQLQV